MRTLEFMLSGAARLRTDPMSVQRIDEIEDIISALNSRIDPDESPCLPIEEGELIHFWLHHSELAFLLRVRVPIFLTMNEETTTRNLLDRFDKDRLPDELWINNVEIIETREVRT